MAEFTRHRSELENSEFFEFKGNSRRETKDQVKARKTRIAAFKSYFKQHYLQDGDRGQKVSSHYNYVI